ncbi:hypothetical protein D9M72_592440 [compost metagenome]
MSTWCAVCSMMWCSAAPMPWRKRRCTVVETKGCALAHMALVSYQATLVWVWCTYSTKPTVTFQTRKGSTKPAPMSIQTDWSVASARPASAPIQASPNAATSTQSPVKIGRRVAIWRLLGKNILHHQISTR